MNKNVLFQLQSHVRKLGMRLSFHLTHFDVSHHTKFPLFCSCLPNSCISHFSLSLSAVVLPVICNAEYCDEDSSVSILCSGVDSNIEITCYYDSDTEPSHPCKNASAIIYLYYRSLLLSLCSSIVVRATESGSCIFCYLTWCIGSTFCH